MKKIFILIISGLFVICQTQCKESISMNVNSYKGSAYDIGFKEGKDVLKIDPYFKFLLKAGVFPKTEKDTYGIVSGLLKDFDPEILDEMKGFANATKTPYEDIVIKLSGYGITGPPIPHGCTQVALLPDKTPDHHLLVGRNYDFTSDKKMADFRLVLLYPDTFNSSIGTSQFIFGRYEGMNEDGLYVGMSFGHGKGSDKNGFFFPIIIRMILDKCKDTDEAIELIKKIPHSATYNYLIADDKNAFDVEVSPPKIAVRNPENNIIVVANHYMADIMKPEQEQLMPNSVMRYELAKTKLNGTNGLDDLKKFMSGHDNDGVCQHYYTSYLGTLWSAVFDLTDKNVYYSVGAPCINEYKIIDFKNGELLNKRIIGYLPSSVPIK